MKKVLKPLFPALLFIFFACETDTQELEFDSKTLDNNRLVEKSAKDGSKTDAKELETMQNIMQWTSYLIAEVLLDDKNLNSENEFIAALTDIPGSSAKLVNIDYLFSDLNSDFVTTFGDVLYTYESNGWEELSDEGCGRPRGGEPIPPPTGGTSTFLAFVNTITNDYCLEIYLPLGYDANEDEITSSAHPLTTSFKNDCFIHAGCDIDLTIHPFNLYSYDNPIVVRPYIDATDSCVYSSLNIDFTSFLSI
jgi:hypothetical protein